MRPTTPGQDLVRGLWKENPVLVQVLGLCPTLAVTNSVINGLSIGLATTFVILGSSIMVAALRKVIPNEVRISAYILIIATFVTIVDLLLAATVPTVHATLGAFIALIVANCIPLARQEVFSCRNTVARSALDAIGTGLGFTLVEVLVSIPREVLGRGSFLGVSLFGAGFQPWGFMILPPGGFFTLGVYLLVFAWWRGRRTPARARPWTNAVLRQRRPAEKATV